MASCKWKYLFTKTILERGKDYFEDGNVYDLDYDGEGLSATVCGSDDYEVGVCFEDNAIAEMWCDCPYAEDGKNCKHMAAALFAWEDELSLQENCNATNGTSAIVDSNAIEDALKKLSDSTVRQLLLERAKSDGGLAERIIMIANGGTGQSQKAAWKSELHHLLRKYGVWDHDCLNYYAAQPYFEKLLDLFYDKVKPLAGSGLYKEAFERLRDVANAASVDCDVDVELYDELMQECSTLIESMLQRADITFKRSVYQTCLHECRGEVSAYRTTHLWQNCLLQYFEEQEFLQKNLLLLDTALKNAAAFKEEYKISKLLSYRADTMTRLGASEAEISEYRKQYWQFPDIRRLAWQEALNLQEWNKAISLLRECKQLDSDTPHLLREYSQRLCELYERQHDSASCRAELTESIFTYRNFSPELIQMLKRNSTDEVWAAELQKILECIPASSDRYNLMIEEDMHRELLDELETDPHLIGLQQYEDALKPYFTEEIRDVFFSYLRRKMESATSREEYTRLVQRLKKMKDYPDGGVMSDELLLEWKITYKRRSALMDEIKKAGLYV